MVQAIDFRANTLGFEARLCYLIYLPFFYLFGIECCYSRSILATTTHPTLLRAPIFHHQEDQDSGFTFFNAGGLDRVCFVNRPGGTVRRTRVGYLHQNHRIYRNNHSHPASPASLYLTSRVPYLMSLNPLSRVRKSQVPTHVPMSLSPCPRPSFIHSRHSEEISDGSERALHLRKTVVSF